MADSRWVKVSVPPILQGMTNVSHLTIPFGYVTCPQIVYFFILNLIVSVTNVYKVKNYIGNKI